MSHPAVPAYKGSPERSVVVVLDQRRASEYKGEGSGRCARLLAALALAVAVAMLVPAFVGGDFSFMMDAWVWRSAEYEGLEVTVHPGDTLWSLAREYGPEGADIRDTVDWIQRENGLSSPLLRPGQRIVVPVRPR